MTKIFTLDEALEYGMKFAEKTNVQAVEGFTNKSVDTEISVEKNIPSIRTGVSTGVSFRVVSKNNFGFCFTRTLTKERIESIIKIAIENAHSKGEDPDFKSLPEVTKKSYQEFKFDKKLESITSDSLADDMTKLIDSINDVKGLHYLQGQLFISILDSHLMNSNGINLREKSAGYGGFGAAITTKGLIPNYSYGIKGGPNTSSFSIDDLIDETIEQTLRAAAPKTMNFEKEVPIILEPEAALGVLGGLFRILATQLSGNKVSSGATPYSDQIGNQVAVEKFNFIDNGINPTKISSSSFDAEGIPKEKTSLIENGVLKTYLLDSYYGNKLGLESNGKSSRSGIFGGGDPIKSVPSIGPSSLEISPGDSSKDEMIEETREGFMVRSLMGLHMSDTSSGRFSVTGFGWYIKNGEVKYPVQEIAISGMIPDLLKNIDLISKEIEPGLLSDCPYIRLASIPTTAKKFDLKTRFGLGVLKILTSLKIMKNPMF
ncbi:MAG TPA: TldD/PmbA family protein [candidate division Zixibacteria bacterium]|nr:TldD/PmbA family protein [candidate division Zixibacteria bacterium]